MSYDVSLHCDCCEQVMQVPPHKEGGIYDANGSHDARLNVTYNYSVHYRKAFDRVFDGELGLRWLHGKSAAFTLATLALAINSLKSDRSDDYREATEGNARHALTILLAWAHQHPKAVWRVA